MNRLSVIPCSVAIALLAACSQQVAEPVASVASADQVAVVDGRSISRSTFNEYVKGVAGKPAEDLTPEQRDELLDSLVRAQLIAADAERSGLAGQEETRAVLELSRLNVLQQASTQNYLKDRKPSEEELRAEYDLQIAGMSRTQYRASHILVPTEAAAAEIIARLKTGANFAQIARTASTDTVSRERGGDLDWFSPDAMTPVFGAAVMQLAKGETSAAPVQTEYGWHVLRVTDTRPATPPPYEGVKDRLARIVEGKKFKAYTDRLMAEAKITKSL